MVLLDGMIRTGRLCEFIGTFYTELHKENDDRTLWEFWLHKVFTKESYQEFKASLEKKDDAQAVRPTDEELQAIVMESAQIMQNFRLA